MQVDRGEAPKERLPSGTVVYAANLTIYGNKIVVSDDDPQPEHVRRRYRWNALLFVLFIGLLAWWFYRHAHVFLSNWLLLLVPALYAAWQAGAAWFGEFFDKDVERVRDKLLAAKGARPVLIYCLVLSVVLLLFTTSFFIELGSGEVTDATVNVLNSSDQQVMRPVELTRLSPTAGRIFFPHFSFGSRLKLSATKPGDYVVREKVEALPFHLGSAPRVNFAEYFEKRKLRALLVIPDFSLYDDLSTASDAVLTISGTRGEQPIVIAPYEFQSVCTGIARPAELQQVFRDNDNADLAAYLTKLLQSKSVSAGEVGKFVADLRTPRFDGAVDFREGEAVHVRLTATGIDPIDVPPVTIGTGTLTKVVVEKGPGNSK
jgi:hypothetical protein